jgi:ABC-2 type transport system ATP-binding protein
MKTTDIKIDSEILLQSLKKNNLGTSQLSDFAEKYVLTNELSNRVIITQLTYFTSSSENRAGLALEIEKLVEEIIKEYDREDKDFIISEKDRLSSLASIRYEKERPMPEEVVRLRGIEKKYTNRKRSGFNLEPCNAVFRLGEITAVVGSNASGKSTLLKMIVGELAQSSGEISFPFFQKQNKYVRSWGDLKHQIAYIPQELPRWAGNLRENIEYEAAIHGILGKECDKSVDYVLERLGLSSYAENRTWDELSGGYKLRFSLAKALVWNPKLLVMDEPLANLDVAAQIVLLNDLRSLSRSFRQPISVIITSQHIHEVENISDYLLVLNNGHMLYNGKSNEYGINHEFNMFELQSTLSLDEIRRRLDPRLKFQIRQVSYFHTVIVPKAVNSEMFVRCLSEANVPILYFRDISKSVKKTFYETDIVKNILS